jgi:hypothetical protein
MATQQTVLTTWRAEEIRFDRAEREHALTILESFSSLMDKDVSDRFNTEQYEKQRLAKIEAQSKYLSTKEADELKKIVDPKKRAEYVAECAKAYTELMVERLDKKLRPEVRELRSPPYKFDAVPPGWRYGPVPMIGLVTLLRDSFTKMKLQPAVMCATIPTDAVHHVALNGGVERYINGLVPGDSGLASPPINRLESKLRPILYKLPHLLAECVRNRVAPGLTPEMAVVSVTTFFYDIIQFIARALNVSHEHVLSLETPTHSVLGQAMVNRIMESHARCCKVLLQTIAEKGPAGYGEMMREVTRLEALDMYVVMKREQKRQRTMATAPSPPVVEQQEPVEVVEKEEEDEDGDVEDEVIEATQPRKSKKRRARK